MTIDFTDHLPLDALDIVSTGETGAWGKVTISIQARSVEFTDAGAAPVLPNAWCYVRSGSPQERAATLKNYLGPVLNVRRGRPLTVSWINKIGSAPAERPGHARSLAMPPINPLPMDLYETMPEQASMNYSVGVATHLHGGKVHPNSDGWPLHPASFESNPFGFPSHRTYVYPNDQRAAMLWFHDHAMDNTAPQVHAGLAGLYFVRDGSDAEIFHLIGDETQEFPLVIQDRILDAGGAGVDYAAGVPLEDDRKNFKRPEFLGDTIFVDGRPWPHVHVDAKVYRLHLLNGSNARTYALALADPGAPAGGKIWRSDLLTAIGNDGGLFSRSEALQATDYLLLAPGERLDVLIDLTQIDPEVTPKLELVNLAVAGIKNTSPPDVEPIFQTDEESVIVPSSSTDADARHAEIAIANVLQFRITSHAHGGAAPGAHAHGQVAPKPPLERDALDKILLRYADDESFHWDAGAQKLTANPRNAPITRNRFVLLMNDTSKFKKNPDPGKRHSAQTNGPWRDTQIWEMRPSTLSSGDPKAFVIPFDAHLTSSSQGTSVPAGVAYEVARAFFFEPEDGKPPHEPRTEDPLWSLVTENVGAEGEPPVYKYPHLYRDNPARGRKVIRPTEGSYERWYVANIGNSQPLVDGADTGAIPDMHPFHMHLVNFVVTRRFVLQKDAADPNKFVFAERNGSAAPARRLDFDGLVRHDTVRVQSNELVELLVHFPKGYTGRYPYHCHLVEHEDMGMMLHFDVQPRDGDHA